MSKEPKPKFDYRDFEIYEYDLLLERFGKNPLGFGHGRTTYEACQNFIQKTGWTPGEGKKALWARYSFCKVTV